MPISSLYHTSSLYSLSIFFLMLPPPPTSTLFPYTTLFRSVQAFNGSGLNPADVVCVAHSASGMYLPLIAERWSPLAEDRKSTRLNSSHGYISYAVFCLKKKKKKIKTEIIHYN